MRRNIKTSRGFVFCEAEVRQAGVVIVPLSKALNYHLCGQKYSIRAAVLDNKRLVLCQQPPPSCHPASHWWRTIHHCLFFWVNFLTELHVNINSWWMSNYRSEGWWKCAVGCWLFNFHITWISTSNAGEFYLILWVILLNLKRTNKWTLPTQPWFGDLNQVFQASTCLH